MSYYATAIPIPPGNADKMRAFARTVLGERLGEFSDLQQRSGVTEEYYWIQSSPDGDVAIVVSDDDGRRFGQIMADPQTDFDRWYRDQLAEIIGLDPAVFADAEPAELLGEYRAPQP